MDFNINEWNRISEDAFNSFTYDAGVLVKNFDPTQFTAPADEDILCTTTGNITASMTANMSNLGDDVNGIHGQFKELEILESWVATMGFTALEMGSTQLKLALGAADVVGSGVKPRMFLKSSDFTTIALILFKIGGGMTAVVLSNALSTGGVSITTTKSGKGNLAVTMTGFQSMNAQTEAAMTFYESQATVEPDVILSRSNVAMTVGDQIDIDATVIPAGETLTVTVEAEGQAGDVIDATASIDNTKVRINANGAGTATITASITVDGTTYSDVCNVTVTAPSDGV